jgi:hypothetical protein
MGGSGSGLAGRTHTRGVVALFTDERYPHPISVKKWFAFNGIPGGNRCKYGILKKLLADMLIQRG